MIAYPRDEERPVDDADTARQGDSQANASPIGRIQADLALLVQAIERYIAARLDAVVLGVRNAVLWIALGAAVLALAILLALASFVLTLFGLAHAVAALLGGRLWAGELLVGGLIFVVVAALVAIGIKALSNASFGKAMKPNGRRSEPSAEERRGNDE